MSDGLCQLAYRLCFACICSTPAITGLQSAAAFADTVGSEIGWSETQPAEGPWVQVGERFMVPYQVTIPGSRIGFTMIPIPGGEFVMGSPESEADRQEDEGPQRQVRLEPFWMGQHEVTWAEYKLFMRMYQVFKSLQAQGIRPVTADRQVDAITVPTPLYEPSHTFAFGDDPGQPAVTMTQYAAKQYTKWLSSLLSQQYRLPAEAEWEYACRAGSQTAYSFGDDPQELEEYAYFADNASDGPKRVGQLKPNAFGLHDMHGNVWEWVVDGYSEEGFPAAAQGQVLSLFEAIHWPDAAYPRAVRGGGWEDYPDRLRSAVRMASNDDEWKSEDPNFPLSPWWFTSDPARGVGFRLVRSANPLPAEAIERFWNEEDSEVLLDVQQRLEEGRAALGLAVPELVEQIKQLP